MPCDYSADIYFLWAVDVRKKNKMKKMEKWDCFKILKTHLNPILMDKTLVGQS